MAFLEDYIQRELTRMDPDLFLDKEFRHGAIYWCVKYNVGSGEPPWTVLDWSVGGHPLDLSSSILDAVKFQEGNIEDSLREIKLNNALKKANVTKQVDEIMDTIAEEFMRSSRVLHRSGPWKPKHDVTAWSNKKKT